MSWLACSATGTRRVGETKDTGMHASPLLAVVEKTTFQSAKILSCVCACAFIRALYIMYAYILTLANQYSSTDDITKCLKMKKKESKIAN